MKLTKSQWGALSPKAQWDILTCMRGPDCLRAEAIKWFSTSVIRGAISGVMRVGGLVNHDLNLVISSGNPPTQGWNGSHFFEHVEEAATWLGIEVVRIPPDVFYTTYNTSYYSTGRRFLVHMLQEDPVHIYTASAIAELHRHLQVL